MNPLQKVNYYLLTNQVLNHVVHVLTYLYPSLKKFTNPLTMVLSVFLDISKAFDKVWH